MLMGVGHILIECRVKVISWMGLLSLGLLGRVIEKVSIVAVEVGIGFLVKLDQFELGILSRNDEFLSLGIPCWVPDMTISLTSLSFTFGGSSNVVVNTKVWYEIVDWVSWLSELSTQVNIWAFGTGANWVTLQLKLLLILRQFPFVLELLLSISDMSLGVLNVMVDAEIWDLVVMLEWWILFAGVRINGISQASIGRVAVWIRRSLFILDLLIHLVNFLIFLRVLSLLMTLFLVWLLAERRANSSLVSMTVWTNWEVRMRGPLAIDFLAPLSGLTSKSNNSWWKLISSDIRTSWEVRVRSIGSLILWVWPSGLSTLLNISMLSEWSLERVGDIDRFTFTRVINLSGLRSVRP